MSTIRREAFRVLVPATSANLGPAFDSAGLALNLYDELIAMSTDDPGVLIEVAGEGEQDVPRDESHLVVRSMHAVFDELGVRPAGLVLRCANVIPHGRGLGSSAAAIIGGMVLARAMVDDGIDRMSDSDLLQIALGFESHPDNLAAALFGGFTIAWLGSDGRADAIRRDVVEGVLPIALVPPDRLSTGHARSVLPDQVALADAAANVARSALLVHALTSDPSYLFEATHDHIHQGARAGVYPMSVDVVDSLREAGFPAVISGAGPTVLAFTLVDGEDVDVERVPEGWRVLRLGIGAHGARVVPLPPLE